MYRFQAKEKSSTTSLCVVSRWKDGCARHNILGPARHQPEGGLPTLTEVDGQAAEVEEPPEDYYDEPHAMLSSGWRRGSVRSAVQYARRESGRPAMLGTTTRPWVCDHRFSAHNPVKCETMTYRTDVVMAGRKLRIEKFCTGFKRLPKSHPPEIGYSIHTRS